MDILPSLGVRNEILNKRRVVNKKFGNLKFNWFINFENTINDERKIQIPEILHG